MAALPVIPIEQAVDGLVAIENIAFALRQVIATRGADLSADGALTLALLDEATPLIPDGVALDAAVHIAAVVIPEMIRLRQAHPMANPVVDAQTSHDKPWWR